MQLWVSALQSIVQHKKIPQEGNLLSVLEHQNEIIKNLLHNIFNGKSKNPQDATIQNILKHIETASVTNVRDKIYKLVFQMIYVLIFIELIFQQGGVTTTSFEFKLERKAEEEKLAHCAAPPFLPKLDEIKKSATYTLILDLDETLVHYFEVTQYNKKQQLGNEGKFLVRPGTEEFLKEMAKYYEIVIFTAATQDYADWVLDKIDPYRHISHRLYRQHAYAKDSNARIIKVIHLFI